MKEKEFRRNMAVFPIGSVMKLTDLSARQIRYYEDQELIKPDRNEGNRRMYSLNDMDRLLEIKDYISEGYNIAAIKKNMLNVKRNPRKRLVRLKYVVHFTMNSSNRGVLLQYSHLLVAVRQPQVVID
ncbi:HTH-type transcriptional regulator glnR [Streptococcus pneumoniae 2070335]|nr:HTH-type transcriptional regulator glnR [Streptococcus pneumoniae 2070335]